MALRYSYARGDLLNNRNSYAYTPYYGKTFINAWRQQRLAFISNSELRTQALATINRGRKIRQGICQSKVSTQQLLDELYGYCVNEGVDGMAMGYLEKLVQRFEVAKRIHDQYDEAWVPVDNLAFYSYASYISYCETMLLCFEITRRLDFLNVTLKCHDTICSFYSRLNEAEKSRLSATILQEMLFVDELVRQGTTS